MATKTEITLVGATCWKCGVVYGLNKTFKENRRLDLKRFYCPNGHGAVFGESDLDIAKRETEQQRQNAEMAWQRFRDERATHDGTKRSLAATKGVVTKQRNRAGAGLCLFCNRHFVHLAKHVVCKHPDEAPEANVRAYSHDA